MALMSAARSSGCGLPAVMRSAPLRGCARPSASAARATPPTTRCASARTPGPHARRGPAAGPDRPCRSRAPRPRASQPAARARRARPPAAARREPHVLAPAPLLHLLEPGVRHAEQRLRVVEPVRRHPLEPFHQLHVALDRPQADIELQTLHAPGTLAM